MHTLLVADDHPLYRDAISAAIASGMPDCCLLEAGSLARALQLAECHEDLDLLLLDLGLPDAEGLSGLVQLRAAFPRLPVAIISAEQDRQVVLEAIDRGAVGYISKSTPRDGLLTAINCILDGQVYLPPEIVRLPLRAPVSSAREGGNEPADVSTSLVTLTDKQLEVLVHIIRGESNKLIARELDIAETTVKTHVSEILRRLSVKSRVQAILAAGNVDVAALLDERRRPPALPASRPR